MYGRKMKLILCLCLVSILIASTSGANQKKIKKKQRKVKDEDRIVNGQDATIQQIPHVVQITDRYSFGPHGFVCGGTIISNGYILTAAHCCDTYRPHELVVKANATFLVGDKGAINRDVVKMTPHPKYLDNSTDYDLCILKLNETLPTGEGVQPVDICDKTWDSHKTVTVCGWGATSYKGEYSNQLQTVELTTLSNSECKDIYKNISPNMACTIVSKGMDACQGDSGGPAFYDGKVCGIVSFGFQCGQNEHPAVYADLAEMRNFITETINTP